MEEIIKSTNENEYGSKNSYAEVGSPDSTEEMKNLESRQAAVTLLQIKNYDPSKYALKPEEPHITYNSGPSLPPAERAREVMHCNAVIDIISKAVAVSQRENEAQKYPPSYDSVIERAPANAPEPSYPPEYHDERYAYGATQTGASPTSNDEHDKEMDLSLYSNVKHEPNEQIEQDDPTYYHGTLPQNTNYADEYKQHVFGRTTKAKLSKDSSSVYEECSQSSSGSDPDRLQMDISQMSQVNK